MFQFVIKKTARALVILLGAVLIVFLLMHAIPGNPWSNYSSSPRILIGFDIDEPLQNELFRRYGLNLPLWRQFARYVIGDIGDDGAFFCGAICGELGPSLQQRGRRVQEVLFEAPTGKPAWNSFFGYSIRLVFLGVIFMLSLGIPLGILSAVKPQSFASRMISMGMAGVISIPNFVLGLLMIIVAATWLKLIKVIPDWDVLSSWIIPAMVLGFMPMANVSRITAEAIRNIIGEDFVRAARAKGLAEPRVILKHVLPNVLALIITYLDAMIMEMFVGLFVVENLFSFPGIGREFWKSVLALDYPMILGLTVVYASLTILINAFGEVICGLLDPRMRVNIQQGFVK